MKERENLRLVLGARLDPVLATPNEVDSMLKKIYGIGAGQVMQLAKERRMMGEAADDAFSDKEVENLDKSVAQDEASIIRLVNEIIAEAIKLGVPITPGVVTPSEIMIGLKLGLKVFKFFPAENYGGLKTIKALSGPFPQIKILPTGGINQNNAAEYFKNPKILAVGGSWMCTKDMISSGDFDGIAEKSAAATALFREIRG